jgi:hypothetical protein
MMRQSIKRPIGIHQVVDVRIGAIGGVSEWLRSQTLLDVQRCLS